MNFVLKLAFLIENNRFIMQRKRRIVGSRVNQTRKIMLALLGITLAIGVQVRWTQTARSGETLTLLEEQPPFTLSKGGGALPDASITVDSSQHFQEFAGFGGAFTEAAAINWRKLSPKDQDKLIHSYFSDPSEGGLGYTMGRVPINSCDFSPAT